MQGVVSELVTSIQFTLSALKGCDVRTLLKNRRLQFQFQCLDVTLTYPGTLFENELFTKPKRLRDYSIALHAIHPSLLKEDSRVLFGILKEEDPSMVHGCVGDPTLKTAVWTLRIGIPLQWYYGVPRPVLPSLQELLYACYGLFSRVALHPPFFRSRRALQLLVWIKLRSDV